MTNYFVADPSCAASCQANVSCESAFAMVYNCPPCDPCDGLTHIDLNIERQNFGEYDSNNNGIGEGTPADLTSPGVETKRFLAGDTLKAYLKGVVNDGSDPPNPHLWEYAFLELDVQTSDFTILGGEFSVLDASTGQTLSCNTLFQYADGSNFITDISAPSMSGLSCSDFDGFEYAGGDSLYLCVYYTPKEPLINVSSAPIIYSPVWYLSDEPTVGTDRDRCNFLVETLNQIGYYPRRNVVINGRNFGGCEISPFYTYEELSYGILGYDEFNYEIRIPGVPQTYTFIKPPEFSFSLDDFYLSLIHI